MNVVLLDLAYLSIHLILFFGLFKRLERFRLERNIFLYHLISFVGFCFLQLLFAPPLTASNAWLSYIAFGICIHGIYSLSFLELWSLTQGSYSLRILAAIKSGRGNFDLQVYQESFEDIGEQKLADRLGA
jgi:hypothetical protein